MAKYLKSLLLLFLKSLRAKGETYDLSKICTVPVSKICLESYPFKHIVIDNFFTDEIYNQAVDCFRKIKEKGLVVELDYTKFHPFTYRNYKEKYEGFVYCPGFDEHFFSDFLFSYKWNIAISKTFGKLTNLCSTVAFHFHPPGNKDGWPHTDNTVSGFDTTRKFPNGLIPNSFYDQPGNLLSKRAIVFLFYLDNDPWQEGDGGETAFFDDKGKNVIKKIAPINNRALIFEMSDKSFHAFMKNTFPRSSVVQWFHTDINLPTKHESI